MKVLACIHSLGGKLDEVTILDFKDNNNVVALYRGVKCFAIFNPFVGRFYVDDIYGIIKEGKL